MLKLLSKLPGNIRQAKKIMNRQTEYWKGYSILHKPVEDKFFFSTVWVYPINHEVQLSWKFKIILAKNVYTDVVFGLMRNQTYIRSRCQVWGLCKLNGPAEVPDATSYSYKGYTSYNSGEEAYQEWIGKLTCP
jgi:hypothetical protein